MASLSQTFMLNNGIQMPAVGFGTFRIKQSETIMQVVDSALNAGYRLFDTAAVYGNESYLNKAFKTLLPKYNLRREDIFITTKLSPSDHGGPDVVRKAYQKSLDNLGVEYVDLYLIHFPGTARLPAEDVRNKKIRLQTWAAMQELYNEGKVKSIGVSNFTVRHLSELLAAGASMIPSVNQVEWHPYYHQPELLSYCKENNIILQAYSSLGGASASNMYLLQDPLVKNIANNLQSSCAQILLAWALQKGVAVIPKSTHPTRITENIRLKFSIAEEDMQLLDSLSRHNIKYAWDPNTVA